MSIRDGGPAFPPNAGWRDDDPQFRGMTLLDWFAGKALTGELSNGWPPNREVLLAERCYEYAEAMLAERERRMNEKK